MNAQTRNLVYTKETDIAHMGLTTSQLDKSNCLVFINIKKFKIFKIRKDYLRIILLLLTI